jgi:hypothetical protein
MSTDTPRHTARKNDARDLAARTGMPYAAALRHVTEMAQPWQPRHRWLITPDLRDWLDGKTWRGVSGVNLRAWLDDEVSPVYECRWCDEPGDARTADSALELLITEYDPDMQPATLQVGGPRKFHAACKQPSDESPMRGGPKPGPYVPSSIAWLRQVDIPSGPQRIGLPATAKPDMSGEFDLEARAILAPAWEGEEWGDDGGVTSHPERAVLLVTARVTEDHGQGAGPWLTELQLSLLGEGLVHADSMAGSDCDWQLRVVTGYGSGMARQWIALRTGRDEQRGRWRHLLLSALDMPAGWAEAARHDGHVTIVIGPCTAHWDGALDGDLEDLADVLERSPLVTPAAAAAGCACAVLTPEHVAELAESGSFVGAEVPVAAEGA